MKPIPIVNRPRPSDAPGKHSPVISVPRVPEMAYRVRFLETGLGKSTDHGFVSHGEDVEQESPDAIHRDRKKIRETPLMIASRR